jgi:FAD/FMN-containing dehydrogenase
MLPHPISCIGATSTRDHRVVTSIDPAFFALVADVVGDAHLVRDPEIVEGYTGDWTGRFKGSSPAVVRPGSTEEVEALIGLCRSHGVAIALQGGNSGLSGGTVPLNGEVVCSLTRFRTLEVDSTSGQATAGAGVTISDLQEVAAKAGWAYGVDIASRGSATVGGSVATNAGGIRVLRHGDTRAQLLGVRAVFGTGQVVSHLSGLVKDNTGYHLPSLLCGSEGTLAVLTAAQVRLVRQSNETVVALLAFGHVGAAIEATAALRRELSSLSAAELFFQAGMALVREHAGLPDPFHRPHAAYLLVEAADDRDPTAELAAAVDSLEGVSAVAVAPDRARGAELWRYREGLTEAINHHGTPHKLDVAVPIGAIGELVERVPGVVSSVCKDAEVWMFGHAADGNVHVNVTGLDPDDDEVDTAVFELAASLGGSVSAEHGIGIAKRKWLHLNRSETEIAVFRSLKRTLDPDTVLNPSVLFGG